MSASFQEFVALANKASLKSCRHSCSRLPVAMRCSFSARLMEGAKLTNLLNRCFGNISNRVGWLQITVAVRGTSFNNAISPKKSFDVKILNFFPIFATFCSSVKSMGDAASLGLRVLLVLLELLVLLLKSMELREPRLE